MPLPYNKKISLDLILYEILNKLDWICYLNPNKVTMFSNFLIPLAAYYFMKNNLKIFMILISIRAVLDLLDGTVARKCNKSTFLGDIFDTYSDHYAIIVILFSGILKVSSNYPIIKASLAFILIFYIYVFFDMRIKKYNMHHKSNNYIGRFVHDNLTFIIPILNYLYYIFVNKYSI